MQKYKEQVKNRFNDVAASYDKYAIVDQTAAQNLLGRLEVIKIAPKTILDLGCGTGYSTKLLAKRYPDAHITAVDISPSMIERAKATCEQYDNVSFQVLDVDQLNIELQSIDMIYANMLLPYMSPLDELLFRFRCLLKPEGLLLFSTLGPSTLMEFRQAEITGLIDMHDLGDLLMQSHLLDPVTEMEELLLQYSSIDKMKQELNGVGIQSVLTDPLDSCFDYYENSSESPDKFGVTFELVYGHAWGDKQLNVTHRAADGAHVMDVDFLRSIK